jgi:hypothetical protein
MRTCVPKLLRYVYRDYEVEYIEELRQAIADDTRIEIHDVTENVDKYYRVRSFGSNNFIISICFHLLTTTKLSHFCGMNAHARV